MFYTVEASIGLTIFHISACWVLGLLRCYVRQCMVKNFWLDDWLAVLALLFYTATAAFYLDGLTNHGFGRHVLQIGNPVTIESGLEDLFFCELLYSVGTGIIKVSFALTLLRVLRDRFQRMIAQATIFFVVALTIFYFFFVCFYCAPVQYMWQRAVDPYLLAVTIGQDPAAAGLKPLGSCRSLVSLTTSTYFQIGAMISIDTILGCILPVLLLKDLHMRRGLKITSGVILALGAVPSIASMARLPYVHTLTSQEILYEAQPFFLWSNIEFAWCLIATAASTLKPLVTRLRILSDSTAAASSYRYGPGHSNNPLKGSSAAGWRKQQPDATADRTDAHIDLEMARVIYGKSWAGADRRPVVSSTVQAGKRLSDTPSASESQEEFITWDAATPGSRTKSMTGISRTVEVRTAYGD